MQGVADVPGIRECGLTSRCGRSSHIECSTTQRSYGDRVPHLEPRQHKPGRFHAESSTVNANVARSSHARARHDTSSRHGYGSPAPSAGIRPWYGCAAVRLQRTAQGGVWTWPAPALSKIVARYERMIAHRKTAMT